MKLTELPEARGTWKFFDLICSTPHPSAGERKLAALLAEKAREAGLTVRTDSFGNLRIDRAPAPGFEDRPGIMLQAHLDMVPQKRKGSSFDFAKDPLPVRVEGEKVHCGGETTLGADDGIGAALAMDMLTDPEVTCGPLAGLFTLEEEIGLNGARALSPAFLEGKFLINLDSGCDSCFYAGCAGGVEDYGYFTPSYRNVPEGNAFRIALRGLLGGHSGAEIHRKRGNAHKFLAAFLKNLGEAVSVSSIQGGSVVNAISRESEAVVVTKMPAAELRAGAEKFAATLAGTFDAPENFGFDVTPCPAPEKVWDSGFQASFLDMLNALPDGVLEFAKELDSVRTSCNLGIIRNDSDGRIVVGLHPRSFVDAEWQELSSRICGIFRKFGGMPEEQGPYAGWKFDPDSKLLAAARETFRELTGKTLPVRAIHAGLETGLFAPMAPELEMISFAPASWNEHTTEEYLEIGSVTVVSRWLRRLVTRL